MHATKLRMMPMLGNYDGPNARYFMVGDLTVYFSYETPIAFTKDGRTVIRENAWGHTTGRHLNRIDTTTERVDAKTFEAALLAAASAF